MKRAIVGLALVASFVLGSATEVEAGRRRRVRRSRVVQRNNNGGGFFSQVMELERRKNAWLRATFLGR